MRIRSVILLFLGALVVSAQTTSPQVVARVSAYPPLSPDEVSRLESDAETNPADIAIRLRLLTHYANIYPAAQAERLKHILYIVENHPAHPAAASSLTYVSPYGGQGDHALVRNTWLRVSADHATNPEIQLNAARFLSRELPVHAEELLATFLNRDPSNRKIAANLGFFYAMGVLGFSSPDEAGGFERLAAHAKAELDKTNNPLVLAGAGTALPNLFMLTKAAMTPNPDRTPFELSSALMARARQLAPEEPELRGPMPLIREFEEFRNWATATEGEPRLSPPPGGPAAIRVGTNVQAAKLTEKPEPIYPDQARQARIQGVVRLNAMIAADGTVENLQLVSGHPLLVSAATDAVRRYRYQPTLLNGTPVKVVTQIDVPFIPTP
jgi:TonB family protein